ncbi:MAG: hypothetical protein MUP58_01865 [Candidatus Nanohaloarchaeota archaeon QJJ-9]|nr:hypothetical protein [Candidatus Nanohaloarchaeota archaeon QJJ-9]
MIAELLSQKRKGQTIGVDFALGMAIFVITVAFGLYYVNTVAMPSSPFGSQITRSAYQSTEKIDQKASWKVKTTPIAVESNYAVDEYPIELEYLFPTNIDKNSTALTQDYSDIPSYINSSSNQILFYGNLSSGENQYQLVYTKDTSLSDLEYDRAVYQEQDSLWNSETNLSTKSDGIQDLDFGGNSMVTDSDLKASSPTYYENLLKAGARFDSLNLSLYKNNWVKLEDNNTEATTYEFVLTENFSQAYVEGTGDISLDGNGTYYSGETDFVDFQEGTDSTYSLGFVGETLDVKIHRNSTEGKIKFNLTRSAGEKKTLLISHSGDETKISKDRNIFLDPPKIDLLLTEEKKGILQEKAKSLAEKSEEDLKQTLGVSGLGINITIGENISMGEKIPQSTEITVIEHPTTFLDRFGNYTMKDLRLAVWMQ